MAYVNDKKVNLGTSYDYDNAVAEIAGLVGVGTRTDGKYYLADVCQSIRINKWAIFRPIPHTTLANLNSGQRIGARHGLDCTVTPDENEYTMYLVDVFAKSMSGQISRIRDFDGYNHLAKYGLEYVDTDGSTTLSYDKLTNAKIRGYNDNNDNIGLEEVKNLLAYWLSHNGEIRNLNKWGVIMYCTTGHIMLEQTKGAYDTLLDSDTNISIMQSNINDIFKVNVPKNKKAYVGVFFTDQNDFKYVVNPTPISYKSITDGYIIDVNRFASHTYVKTATNLANEMANWRDVALDVYGEASNGVYDQIAFACHLKNDGDKIPISYIRLKMTFNSGPASIKGKTIYHSLTFPNYTPTNGDFMPEDTIGTDAYKNSSTQKSDFAFFISSKPILEAYGATISGYSLDTTIQLVLMKTWENNMPYRILTSPIKMALRFNNTTCSGTPMFSQPDQNFLTTTHSQED